jgi:hypothetical protein
MDSKRPGRRVWAPSLFGSQRHSFAACGQLPNHFPNHSQRKRVSLQPATRTRPRDIQRLDCVLIDNRTMASAVRSAVSSFASSAINGLFSRTHKLRVKSVPPESVPLKRITVPSLCCTFLSVRARYCCATRRAIRIPGSLVSSSCKGVSGYRSGISPSSATRPAGHQPPHGNPPPTQHPGPGDQRRSGHPTRFSRVPWRQNTQSMLTVVTSLSAAKLCRRLRRRGAGAPSGARQVAAPSALLPDLSSDAAPGCPPKTTIFRECYLASIFLAEVVHRGGGALGPSPPMWVPSTSRLWLRVIRCSDRREYLPLSQ